MRSLIAIALLLGVACGGSASTSRPVVPVTSGGGCGVAFDAPTCAQKGGTWEHGMAGGGQCACPTGDGGKTCRTSKDCEAFCELPFDEAKALEGKPANDIPPGICASAFKRSGCLGWIEDADGIRVVRAVCHQ